MGRLYYITGGAGSGKSEYAEQLAERLHTQLGGPLYYVATMNPAPRDADAAARIAKHQKRRAGRGYTTLECPTDIAQLHAQALNNAVFIDRQRDDSLVMQRGADKSGHQEDQHRPHFEKRAENRAAPRRSEIFSGQSTLNDVLIRTPVPDADDD